MPAAATAPVPDLTGKSVWVIDTLSRVYQLFHALPEMTSPQGTPVAAVYGFTRDLLDVVEKKKADYLFCALDAPGPTFRHEKFEAYKANRAEMPADLVPQVPLVRRLLEVMGIPCLEMPGYEADDVLATLARQVTEQGGQCVLATSDKDARQLLSDRVRLLNLRTNAFLGPEELRQEWGIRPDQVVDYLSLVGDSADNVPGVPLIGPKIASELLQRHDTLDHVLAHPDVVSGKKRQENLRTHAEVARASRELVRLDADVPVAVPWEAGRLHACDAAALAAFLQELGFQSLTTKVRKSGPAAAPAAANQRTMFDLAGESPAAVAPRMGETVGDDAALAAVVGRLRDAGPLAVCVAVATEPTSPGAPPGIALATADDAVWIGREILAAHDRPGTRALADLLGDATVEKIGHDLKRQRVALRAAGYPLAGGRFDTLLAAYLLDAGERNHGLAEVARRHGVDPGAGPDESLERPGDQALAVQACDVVHRLRGPLAAALETAGLSRLFTDVEVPLSAVLADMEIRGVRIDRATLESLSAEYTGRLTALESEIHTLAGHAFSIASPQQVRGVLFDELGLPVVKRTKTGPSTDAEVLEELAPLHPLPAKLLEHRKYAKLKSTYVDALPALVSPATGRIHTTFNQTVTATGRLSSSDPNLQNIPVRSAEGQQIRAAFRPGEPGWRFVAADYSQIELRILAHLSGDAAMRAAFAAGEDIHTRTAAAVYGVEPAAVTAAMRRTAKAVNFGILYGQSAFGLAQALSVPQPEAAAFIQAYFRTFAGAAAFIDEVLDRCRRDGQVTTILGRRRTITGVRDRAGRRNAAGMLALSLPERTAINTVVQGSAADLIKIAMLGVARRLEAERRAAAIVLQIHDELVVEAPAEEVPTVRDLLLTEMRGALRIDVPLEVTVHEGATWAECEKGGPA
ncbi:MAG: DNA polymerase I [Planctomycetia bacterium]|nr:DNA polymerase I [Planctomycetia bacterium]